jgi:hypothetical protein
VELAKVRIGREEFVAISSRVFFLFILVPLQEPQDLRDIAADVEERTHDNRAVFSKAKRHGRILAAPLTDRKALLETRPRA